MTLTLLLCRSILMAGILPFGAMFIELFFIFSVSTATAPAPPRAPLLACQDDCVGREGSGNPVQRPQCPEHSICF